MDLFDLLIVQQTLKNLLQHTIQKINSLMLSLPYSPTLTSVHDYRKHLSFDYTYLCQQSDVSSLCFLICCLRSVIAGEGIGYTLQYSGLENSMDCVVRGVAKSRT